MGKNLVYDEVIWRTKWSKDGWKITKKVKVCMFKFLINRFKKSSAHHHVSHNKQKVEKKSFNPHQNYHRSYVCNIFHSPSIFNFINN